MQGDGRDTIYGTDSQDAIHAREGADKVYGRGGDDRTIHGEGLYGDDGVQDTRPSGRDFVDDSCEDVTRQ